jgi:hypothetical protein
MANWNEKRVKSAAESFLEAEEVDSIEGAVDMAAELKEEYDIMKERLDAFKDFFRVIGEPGEQFEGAQGYVLLTPRSTTASTPAELHATLEQAGLGDQFLDLVSVKIAPARKALGTTLFDKCSQTEPATPSVKIGRRK